MPPPCSFSISTIYIFPVSVLTAHNKQSVCTSISNSGNTHSVLCASSTIVVTCGFSKRKLYKSSGCCLEPIITIAVCSSLRDDKVVVHHCLVCSLALGCIVVPWSSMSSAIIKSQSLDNIFPPLPTATIVGDLIPVTVLVAIVNCPDVQDLPLLFFGLNVCPGPQKSSISFSLCSK